MSARPVSPRTSRLATTASVPYVRTPKKTKKSTASGRSSAASQRSLSQSQTRSPRSPRGSTKKRQPSVQDDPRYEEYSELSVKELRIRKGKAIEEMDFDTGEFIEKVIQSRVDTAPTDMSSKGSDWIKERIDELLDNYFKNLDEFENTYRDKEISIRENEYDVFQKIRERHLLEIEEVETARAVQLHIDEESVCGQAIVMQKQAKTLAKANNFQAAKDAAKKAEQIRMDHVEQRKEKTNLKYDRELKKLLSQQETQLSILQDRLQQCIDDNGARKEEDILSLQKESSVFAKSQLQKIIIDGAKQLHTNEQKAQFISDINASYMKNIFAFEKEKETKLPFLYI